MILYTMIIVIHNKTPVPFFSNSKLMLYEGMPFGFLTKCSHIGKLRYEETKYLPL